MKSLVFNQVEPMSTDNLVHRYKISQLERKKDKGAPARRRRRQPTRETSGLNRIVFTQFESDVETMATNLVMHDEHGGRLSS